MKENNRGWEYNKKKNTTTKININIIAIIFHKIKNLPTKTKKNLPGTTVGEK